MNGAKAAMVITDMNIQRWMVFGDRAINCMQKFIIPIMKCYIGIHEWKNGMNERRGMKLCRIRVEVSYELETEVDL